MQATYAGYILRHKPTKPKKQKTEFNIMIFTMKFCPPQVNQKQTIVAKATGFVFLNLETWGQLFERRLALTRG